MIFCKEFIHIGLSQESYYILRDQFRAELSISEAFMGVYGIQDICHFTTRDIGYYPFYFERYRKLCSIFSQLSGISNI